jgi:hypothetical protein
MFEIQKSRLEDSRPSLPKVQTDLSLCPNSERSSSGRTTRWRLEYAGREFQKPKTLSTTPRKRLKESTGRSDEAVGAEGALTAERHR